MITFPNAKINLGLDILRKRVDGYHDIESCLYPIPWYDSLEIIESDSFSFYSYGQEIPGSQGSNLCIKAYEILTAANQLPAVEIHLLKAIPMGAGLGGGSADGAFTLKMLNELFELHLSTTQLQEYALQLGSDCPFFIENNPVIVKGRGEASDPIRLDLSGYFLALLNPGIHISTQEAYSGIYPHESAISIAEMLSKPMLEWKNLLQNDFEPSIFKENPAIRKLKELVYEKGAIYASMTGSGSTVYGIFEESPEIPGWKIISL